MLYLPITAGLLGAAAISAFFFIKYRAPLGAIKLPEHRDDVSETNSEPELLGEKDPFDVTSPLDFHDGDPIKEELFWTNIKLRKVGIVLNYAILLCLSCIAFGYALVAEESSDVLSFALHAILVVYLLTICTLSIAQTDITTHWPTVINISCISTLSLVLLLTASIVPTSHSSSPSQVTRGWWLACSLLHAISTFLIVTTPRGPELHFPPAQIYSQKTLGTITNSDKANVCGIVGGCALWIISFSIQFPTLDASPWSYLLFSYTTKVVMLGNVAESLEIGDLPIVPADMRAATIFAKMRSTIRKVKLRGRWQATPGSGWETLWRLVHINKTALIVQTMLAMASAGLFYGPAFFLQRLVKLMETRRDDLSWGYVYCAGLFGVNALMYLISGQLWSISTTVIQSRMKIQLNSTLFAKCLVRKDVAIGAAASEPSTPNIGGEGHAEVKQEEDDFSSKAQIMTLMTTDVDRVSDFSWHLFSLVDSPIEIVIGAFFLYKLLGVSSFIGLAFTCFFLPMNHWAGKVVVTVQEGLMKSRDERVALMNEVLGAIRMIKFMAWERSFEERVMKLRAKELSFQRRNYIIETLFNIIWNATPIFVTLVAFWHFAIVRGQTLTPSIAFTSIAIFSEMKFALNALPETFINMLQGFVSLRRIERYLISQEIPPAPYSEEGGPIVFNSATISWPQSRFTGSTPASVVSTPRKRFVLMDLNLDFPLGELSLICGRLGSGKTLLLLGLLGEADVLAGQVLVPRTPPDSVAKFSLEKFTDENWIVPGICAYVPQSAWLQNASIKQNILFNLPFNESRYYSVLEACALNADLAILEDGDESEIGERGVNLSGGQKARVSLARAVYSRASILMLDDVLSAVDAHTAHHLYHRCLLGPLMASRTVILVSHHVQLSAQGAKYIVALEGGRVAFQGDRESFLASTAMAGLVQGTSSKSASLDLKTEVDDAAPPYEEPQDQNRTLESSAASTVALDKPDAQPNGKVARSPRKLIEEEVRAVGRIGRTIWSYYLGAIGGWPYWLLFVVALLAATLSPVAENGWLRIWSGGIEVGGRPHSPAFYISVYTAITMTGLVLSGFRWFVLYFGGLHASSTLYAKLLEAVLRAQIRFHDTVSRGRLLNRFGKDFETIDSKLPDSFGRSIMYGLNAATTLITVTYVGGWPFFFAAIGIGAIYFNTAKVYGQTSRDMRRLDSVTRSPLYSIYGETIAGVTIIRAFGAGSKFLRDMLQCVDTNVNPYFWMWGVNRWLSVRFNMLSSLVVGVTGLVVLLTPGVDASLAGFALAFASNLTHEILFMVRRFVGLEQAMVAVERVKEFSDLTIEPPEYMEPRPPKEWPHEGSVSCEGLAIRYSPELPNVLHNISFEVRGGEKIGILGRTGSGKSTLALSFFRFVEATEGRIIIDGLDISKIGLTDLRSRLTIIPQDPTILSGTIRSTLDVFNEYSDEEIFESLRRVHLLPDQSEEGPLPSSPHGSSSDDVNANVFQQLDSVVSEGGDNFSTGEKQLLCMARAILKRSKLLVMDEATASVDYATDELIGKTIREEFADSTILTIAHRLRTVIDYNRIMVLDDGKLVEFDTPQQLLSDPASKFYALCKAAGPEEFQTLKNLALGQE